MLRQWDECVQPVRQSLQCTVLVEDKVTKRLYVNFDQIISELCREANMLQQIKAKISEPILAITLHEKRLLTARDQL